MLQQQVHEVVLLPQEGHELRMRAAGERWTPGPTSPRSPARPARGPGTWSVLRLMRTPMTLLKKLANNGLRLPLLCKKP